MKKHIALLLALVITAGILAACAAGVPSSSSLNMPSSSAMASVASSAAASLAPSSTSSSNSEIQTGFLLLEETSEGNVYKYTNVIVDELTGEEKQLLSIYITLPADWTISGSDFVNLSQDFRCSLSRYNYIGNTTFDLFLLNHIYLPHYMPPMVDSIKYYLPETYEQANDLSVYTYLTELHWWDTGVEYCFQYFVFIDASTILRITFSAYETRFDEYKVLFDNIVNSIDLNSY